MEIGIMDKEQVRNSVKREKKIQSKITSFEKTLGPLDGRKLGKGTLKEIYDSLQRENSSEE
jgi:hypothetical protein